MAKISEILEKYPILDLSYASLKEADRLNHFVSLRIGRKEIYEYFLDDEENIQEGVDKINRIINEIKENNIKVNVNISKEDASLEDLEKLINTKDSDLIIDLSPTITFLFSDAIEAYLTKIEDESNGLLELWEKEYSYDYGYEFLFLDNIVVYLNEELQELDTFDEFEKKVNKVKDEIEKEYNVKIFQTLSKTDNSHHLNFNLKRRANNIFKSDRCNRPYFTDENMKLIEAFLEKHFGQHFDYRTEMDFISEYGNPNLLISSIELILRKKR